MLMVHLHFEGLFFGPNDMCSNDGQLSGPVLVYRNPGLHFGDIHVLKATYVEELESFVGNAKYGIFFSCKGPRSVADEIAGGDFDGDLYWISRNPQVGIYINHAAFVMNSACTGTFFWLIMC